MTNYILVTLGEDCSKESQVVQMTHPKILHMLKRFQELSRTNENWQNHEMM